MIDTKELAACLHTIGLDDWSELLTPLITERLSEDGHGDYDGAKVRSISLALILTRNGAAT